LEAKNDAITEAHLGVNLEEKLEDTFYSTLKEKHEA
jgi:hypothetical protein